MLRAMADLLPPAVDFRAGEIIVGGINARTGSGPDIRRLHGELVGMIFQEPRSALNPTMRIGRQIAESAMAHNSLSRRQAMDRAMELLGLMGFAEPKRHYRLYPHELSGGMCQRVVIAIALAGEPKVLLCDEPTTALDATVTLRVLELLVDRAREMGIAVVFVTHDLGVASRVCDRIAVMYAGRVVEEGPASEVLRQPRHPYTLALLRAVPTRDSTIEELRAIPGAPPGPGQASEGCPFAPRCEFAQEACQKPVELRRIENDRQSACRREKLLGEMAEAASA